MDINVKSAVINRSDFSDPMDFLSSACHFLRKYSNTFQDECLELAQESLKVFENENLAPCDEMAVIKDQLAYQLWHHGKPNEALIILEENGKHRKKDSLFLDISWGIMTKAMILWNRGEYRIALEIVQEGLKFIKVNCPSEKNGVLKWALGVFYFDMKDYERSISNYSETLRQCEENEYMNFNSYAYTCIGMGCAWKGKGDYKQAVNYLLTALNCSRENNLWMEESRALYEIGLLEKERGEFERAEQYLNESMVIREKNKSHFSIISNLIALAQIKHEFRDWNTCEEFYSKALSLSSEVGSLPKKLMCHEGFSILYKSIGDYKKALVHLEKATEIGKTLNNSDLERRFDEIRIF
jgi:tetratricopeptide (TPR) repeat protein